MRDDAYNEAQAIVKNLLSSGMTADQISRELDNRVSARTIYRWRNGESSPQQPSDLDALRKLQPKGDQGDVVPEDGHE